MNKLLSIFFMIFALSGCAMQGWKYTSEPKTYTQPISRYKLVVPPLRDLRDNENSMSGYFISMIPLVPYGTSVTNIPDLRLNVKPVEEFSKVMAEEIDNASIFKSSIFEYGKQGGDLYLVGNLKNSKHTWNSTFYGLSIYGALLWYTGLPNGKYHFNIDIDYSLVDGKGKTYFSKEYSAYTSNLTGLYYGLGELGFEKSLKKIALDVIADLKTIAPKLNISK